jgi:hypothetical protein
MNDEWDFNWGETEAQALNSKQILLFCNFISFNEDTWRILLPLPFIFMSLDRWQLQGYRSRLISVTFVFEKICFEITVH